MSAPRKKLTRKRLNNALVQVYRNRPNFFQTPPTPMSFFDHVYAGNLDDVQEFIEEQDFDIGMQDVNGNGCLFYAVEGSGGLPMVKLLLKNGADINMMNFIGEVPLHIACRNFTSNTQNKLDILDYMLDQDNLLLVSFFGKPIEDMLYSTIRRIDDLHEMYIEKTYNGTVLPQEEEDYHTEQMALWSTLIILFQRIEDLSEINVKHVNVQQVNTKGRMYYFLDTRMTGRQFRLFMLRQVFRNPLMNLDFFFGGKLLDPTQTLEQQGIIDESTITYQVRLMSGLLSKGGKRKTRKRT
jgi:hypothetical protein